MTETQQRNYRGTFILNTRDYDQSIENLIGSIKESMQGVGATLGEVRDLGRKEFVRVTDKKHVGDVYVQIDFSGDSTVASKVRERFLLEKTVTRLLIESR
jgi:small subunit ribosomal protein S6